MFSQSELEGIAQALGDTEEGLTGSEIGQLILTARMNDPTPGITKWKRLYNAFVETQNTQQHRRNVLAFIRFAMKPERFLRNPARFEPLRANLNRALAFSGLAVEASGEVIAVERAETLSDAQRRAQELRADLLSRGVHPDVLAFCRAEFVADNYFHAVLEAAKSISEKLRKRTGLTGDGTSLVDAALCGERPLLQINPLRTDSEWSEQRGFANLIKGVYGMFRNPTAHEPRVLWQMSLVDAEDLLSVASLIHRRLDAARARTSS
jgi:uncharacterized protein (TIGR02391 family)